MFVALVRACVLSSLGVSLRTSSYAMPTPLITITALLQTYERKNKKKQFYLGENRNDILFVNM